MSTAKPPTDPASAFLKAQMQRLAGRLLLASEAAAPLSPIVRDWLGDTTVSPAALATAVAKADEEVRTALAGLGRSLSLGRLISAYGLSLMETDLLCFALLPELDDRFGDAFAALRQSASARRPTLGLSLRALFETHEERWLSRRHLEGSLLWEAGLLRLPAETADGGAAQRSGLDSVLWPSAPVVGAAFSHCPARLDGGAEVGVMVHEKDRAGLRPGLSSIVDDLARWVETVQCGMIHLVCENTADGSAIAERLAAVFGRPLVTVAAIQGSPETALHQAAQCAITAEGLLFMDLEGIEALRVPGSFRAPGPVLLASSSRAEVRLPQGTPARRVDVARPRPTEQAELWHRALGASATGVRISVLANRTTLSTRQIGEITARATEQAKAAGRAAPTHEDIVQAMGEAVPDPSSPLARMSRPTVAWSRLVLDRETRTMLDDMVARVEHRVTVQDEWGLRGPEGRGEGLVAMFHGEPGTGKTLAAEALAARAGLSLWRVDLSRVVSKYIGETEKQLSSLFDAAEGFRAVLFFDEADTLFSKRTGVRDAHDRYANLETNYMLSRLEVFEGLAILATNFLQNIDTAFMRRLSFIVPFPRPGTAQRRRLWLSHLPKDRLAADVDIDRIAGRHELTGGEIKGAALSAAFAAAAAASEIDGALIEQAIWAERLKAGKAVQK